MRIVPIIISILLIGTINAQEISQNEVRTVGDNLLKNVLKVNSYSTSYTASKDSYISYFSSSKKKKNVLLDKKQVIKGQLDYAQLFYDIKIEYPLCPEFSALEAHVIIHIDSNSVGTIQGDQNLKLPSFYWKGEACSVIDSNKVREIANTLEFKKGIGDVRIQLLYNPVSMQLEWHLDNLLWKSLEPNKSGHEIVVLEAESGKLIKRYEIQYPIGSGM